MIFLYFARFFFLAETVASCAFAAMSKCSKTVDKWPIRIRYWLVFFVGVTYTMTWQIECTVNVINPIDVIRLFFCDRRPYKFQLVGWMYINGTKSLQRAPNAIAFFVEM